MSSSIFSWMATPPFVPRMLLAQLRMDLLAKEAETGFTYTYVWLADQLGHFSLGFLPTYVISWFAISLGLDWSVQYAQILALVGCCVAALKEMLDVRRSAKDSREGHFPELYDRCTIIFNAITATGYMCAGLLVALAATFGAKYGLAAFLFSLLISIPVAYYWLRLRYIFQQSGTPYVRRIWTFPGTFRDEEDLRTVSDFLSGKLQHLIITGSRRTGKTTLAISLATEQAAKGRYVRYLSWFDLTELSDTSQEAVVQAGTVLWRWSHCEACVVDDIVIRPEIQVEEDKLFGTLHQGQNQQFLDILGKQKTVWILSGSPDILQASVQEIRRLLKAPSDGLKVVSLTQAMDPDTGLNMRGKLS